MEQRHALAEARSEAAEGLRRQRDLRHEDDCTAPCRERGFAGADVDLGLAAARSSGEQDVPAPTRQQALDVLERALLRLGEVRRRGLGGQSSRRGYLPPIAAPGGLLRCDQRERTRRSRAVVVRDPEREIDECRRQGLEHVLGGDRLHAARRLGIGVDHDPAPPRVAEADREDCSLPHVVSDLVRERPRERTRTDDGIDGGEAGHGQRA